MVKTIIASIIRALCMAEEQNNLKAQGSSFLKKKNLKKTQILLYT